MNAPTPSQVFGRNTRPRSSAWWAEHFKRDVQRDWTIPWHVVTPLSSCERNRIAKSIAEFQRGESSEARNYLEKSARFAPQAEPAFHVSSLRFVANENLHAELLLRFMQLTEVPARGASPRDAIFRWLRSCSDLGWSSRVIIIAELVAQEYYPCLRAATHHPVLTRICDRVIAEEAAHIHFQIERIVRVEARQSPTLIKLRDAAQLILMLGTACVVYAGHRPVLNVRYGFLKFFRRLQARNRDALSAMTKLRRSTPPAARATADRHAEFRPRSTSLELLKP
jgi:hypothetical protein